MEKMNSYYGRALSDYKYAKAGMSVGEECGDYNNVAALCAQACEKFMRAIIELAFCDDEDILSLMKTHNLRSLYNKIVTKYELTATSKDCKWLGDFYFDARYPGDNFVIVSRNDALECFSIIESIQKDTDKILQTIHESREEKKKTLNTMRLFSEQENDF